MDFEDLNLGFFILIGMGFLSGVLVTKQFGLGVLWRLFYGVICGLAGFIVWFLMRDR